MVLITSRLQNPDLDAINGTENEQQRDGFTNELYGNSYLMILVDFQIFQLS